MGLSCTFDVKINTRAKASQNGSRKVEAPKEVAPMPKAAPKKKPAAKKAAPKKAAGPAKINLRQASLEAIAGIKSRTGTSARKIIGAVKASTGSTNEAAIKRALKALVASGALINAKGQGIAGSLKISPAESAKRAAKSKAAKSK